MCICVCVQVDRCYIHGDAQLGQKRGIALNSANTNISNCYISDIKLVGQDTQAIGGWNGPVRLATPTPSGRGCAVLAPTHG